jgi:hypothetical protein
MKQRKTERKKETKKGRKKERNMNEPSLLVPHLIIYIYIGPEATEKGRGHVRMDNNTKTMTGNLRFCLCAFVHKTSHGQLMHLLMRFLFIFIYSCAKILAFVEASVILRSFASTPAFFASDTVASNASSRQSKQAVK